MLFRSRRGAIKGTVPTQPRLIPELRAERPLPWEDAAEERPFLLQSKQAPAHFGVPLPPAKAPNAASVGLRCYSPRLESSALPWRRGWEIIGDVPAWEQGEARAPLPDPPRTRCHPQGKAQPGSAPTCPAALRPKDGKCKLHTLSQFPTPLTKG